VREITDLAISFRQSAISSADAARHRDPLNQKLAVDPACSI
jgi:hypothetical protein